MNDYMIGCDIIGAEPSPADIADLKRGLALVDKAAADALAAQKKPNFFQREAFGGLKVWQVMLAGGGVALMLGGTIALVARKR